MGFNMRSTRVAVVMILVVGALALSASLFTGQGQKKVYAANTCQFFPQTNHNVCGAFLEYWTTHGGLAQQGYPVSDVFSERNQDPPAGDGQVHNVQYFERARFEEHLESTTNPVQLGLLGSEQYKAKYSQSNPPSTAPNSNTLVINSKSRVTSINGNSAGAGNVFLVLDVTLSNNSANAVRSSTDGFALSDNQPLQYFVSSVSSGLDTPWSSQILFPGSAQRAKIAFEIPSNFQPQSLNFTYSDSFKASVNF